MRALPEEGVAVNFADVSNLVAEYLELAKQSEKNDESTTIYDPIPWDRLRNN
jgi:hypothetical protein